jgi:PEP-CTERM motif
MKLKRTSLALSGALATMALATPAYADGGLTFLIDGDTFSLPFTITNTSTAGESVVGFGISLIAPFGFDTVNGGFGIDNSTAFAPQGGTDVATGYTGPASFADGVTSIDFTFTDFAVGESFVWLIDVDNPQFATVFGNELIGSTGYADFSNGLRGLGVFEAVVGNDDAAQFVIRTFTPSPGVPEPAAWAMMLGGFGLIGAAMRRRKDTMAITYA